MNQTNKYNLTAATSEYRGVGFHKRSQTWRARIRINGKLKEIGAFKSPEEAAIAYDRTAIELLGTDARTNILSAPDKQSKVCPTCKSTLPLTNEFFGNNKSACDGLAFECRSCACKRSSAFQKTNPERCNIRKAKWDRRNPEKKRATGARYIAANADKVKAANEARQARKRTPEHRAKMRTKYADNKEKMAAYYRDYYLKNRETIQQNIARYAAANPHIKKVCKARRRARMIGASGQFTSADVAAQFEKQGGLCFYCQINLDVFHADHFIPLAKGGNNNPDNIVCACQWCNLSKGSTMPDEFIKRISARA